jgi:UDP-glucose:(heptosyl)LPS alpha-1,3-glucosyltransferase
MRMALVHMRHATTGGTERYLNHVAEHLARRGHDVTIVCRSHEAPPHAGVRFEALRPLAIGATMRMTSFARAVERHVAHAHYDVVYGLGKTWSHDVVRLGGGCHQTYLDRMGGAVGRKDRQALEIEARALAAGGPRRVVVNSKMVADDVVRRHGVARERLRLVYNGVDLQRFHPRHRSGRGAALRNSIGIGEDDLAILFLGTGYRRKGLDQALGAFALLAAEKPEARLVVAGRDANPDAYRQRARDLGIDARVRFLGPRTDAEICFAACDLYLIPTRYDPFANTTLEALASGLPVITSRGNGGSELLEEGVDGSVIAEIEVEPLANALRAWCDRDRLHDAAARARETAELHPIERKCAETEVVLEEVAAEKAGSLPGVVP